MHSPMNEIIERGTWNAGTWNLISTNFRGRRDGARGRSLRRRFGGLTSQTIPRCSRRRAQGRARVCWTLRRAPVMSPRGNARGASVAGVDFSSEMVALASRRIRESSSVEGDAEALAFPDRSFDAVAINSACCIWRGLTSSSRRQDAFLRPGGRCAFTVWQLRTSPWDSASSLKAIRRTDAWTSAAAGQPFFRFSDAAEWRAAWLAAGFSDRVSRPSRSCGVWRLETRCATRSSGRRAHGALLRAQTPEAMTKIRRVNRGWGRGISPGRPYQLPMAAVLSSES